MVKRALALALLRAGLAWGEPSGPQVIHGQVNIQTNGSTTLINQATDRAIINWSGFNIDVHELVRFVQPNQLSVILNRVVGSDPSTILGSLQANGRVFLINPNGVLFGPSARVEVGGLMATTLNLSDQDFLAGRYHLTQDPNHALASVVNQGELRVADGGFLLLVAPVVDNQGLIVARAGQVGLVGSSEATLNFDGQGLVEIRLPQGQLANPGSVLMPPQAVSEVLRQVVNDPGIVEAGRLPRAEGVVVQQGQLQAERVVLDSASTTLVAAGSLATAQQLRVLSQGTSRLEGSVSTEVVELSGAHFRLAGQLTAQEILIDPVTLHITDSDQLSGGVDEVTRGFLEALPAGSQLALEADHLIQVDNMALNQINLAPNLDLHFTAHSGDIVFQDSSDHMFTAGGGSLQFDAPHGSVTLGLVTAPGGEIVVQAGADIRFNTLNVLESGQSRLPGTVTLASTDIYLGSINAGNSRLEASNNILAAPSGSASVEGNQASFVAGDLVGEPGQEIFVDLIKISGLANQFNFSYEQAPVPGLVNGIDGLMLRPCDCSAPSSPSYFQVLDTLLLNRVDQVPVFQLSENTAGFGQPVSEVAETEVVQSDPLSPGPNPGEPSDAYSFLASLPGLNKNVQVCDSQKFVFLLGPQGLMPWIEAFAAHGYRVRTTADHFEAWKGDDRAEGIVSGQRFFLKVGPRLCFAISNDDNDLTELMAWLKSAPGILILSQSRLVDSTRYHLRADLQQLLQQLTSHGWDVKGDTAWHGFYRLQLKSQGDSLWLTLVRTPK